MFPPVPEGSDATLSSNVYHPTMEGGVAPFTDPLANQISEFGQTHFVVIPMSFVKPYSREYVEAMCGRFINSVCDNCEAWHSPFSLMFRVTCEQKVFERITEEVKAIFTTFGGDPESLQHYLSTNPDKL